MTPESGAAAADSDGLLNRLYDIFSFKPHALAFNEMYFWVYLLIIYTVYAFIYNRTLLRNSYLFAVSIFFYFKLCGVFTVLLLYTTFFDYLMGQAIFNAKSPGRKKALLAISIISNMLLLCYFKYGFFLTDTINEIFNTNLTFYNYFEEWQRNVFEDKVPEITDFLVPIGISFYTFQSISYAVDIYRGHLKPVKHFVDFAFFVSFFPQLLMGPIVRAIDFIPQIYKPYDITKKEFSWACFMIIKGLIKKIVVADFIKLTFIDPILFDKTEAGTFILHSGFENLNAMWAYSMFIYADFSGYTDIAIGLGMIMGFRLHQNFNSPYKATSVADFWRRWHMSLSSWLRDYLYIPLGGNRKGTIGSYICIGIILLFIVAFTKMYMLIPIFIMSAVVLWCLAYYFPKIKTFITTDINLLITMILGGLWHGGTINFLKWGALNGVGLVVYKYWKRISPYEKSNHWIAHFWKVFITFNFITFTRIFFLVQDPVRSRQVMDSFQYDLDFTEAWSFILKYAVPFTILFIAFIIHWLPTRAKEGMMNTYINLPQAVQVAVFVISIALVFQAVSEERVPFTYQAF